MLRFLKERGSSGHENRHDTHKLGKFNKNILKIQELNQILYIFIQRHTIFTHLYVFH